MTTARARAWYSLVGALLVVSALLPAGASGAPAPAGGIPQTPPVELPSPAGASRAGASDTWIVGGRPGAATERIARRSGARPLLPAAGVYAIDRHRARPLAAALRAAGRLSFAEPSVRSTRAGFPSDPLTPRQWWLPAVVDPGLTPPPVTAQSPRLGVVDAQVDLTHPDLREGNVQSTNTTGVTEEHGTAVSGIAGAAANGTGIVGIWPGMRVLVAPDEQTCESVVAAVNRLVAARVAVINMSYGFAENDCYAHYLATQYAFGQGVLPVASGGNEFQEGNLPIRPASDPHVLSVAATTKDNRSAEFSNQNQAIDISAPGVDVLTTVPLRFDVSDGARDGYAGLPGTSFSSPMVAAAATWLRAERPTLANGQIAEILRSSARDLGPRGYDSDFGNGLLDVGAALASPTPVPDLGEPNDDIEWIDGRRFASPDPSILRSGQASSSLDAKLHRLEDPIDVWRLVAPPRSTLSVRTLPRFGDPDLEAFRVGARTVFSQKRLIGRSIRPAGKTDTLTVTNRLGRPATVFVSVYIDAAVGRIDAAYRLQVRRR